MGGVFHGSSTRAVIAPRGLRSTIMALGVVSAVACSEGYPGKESAVASPADMTQAQRMTAINLLGREAHPGERRRYVLQPNCVLEITFTRRGESQQTLRAPLQGASLKTAFDKATRIYDIQIVPPEPSDSVISVLMTPRWTDAVEARSLLQFLQVGCAPAHRSSATAAAAGES